MVQHLYPDYRGSHPDQRTFKKFVREAKQLYTTSIDPEQEDNAELKFLKFILAGCRGLNLHNQFNIIPDATQSLPPFQVINITYDYDSLISIMKDLPYFCTITT